MSSKNKKNKRRYRHTKTAPRRISFTTNAWEEYLVLEASHPKWFQKTNVLLKDTLKHPFEGQGKPEALRHDLAGLWSRRINSEHRLVYKVEDDVVIVLQCMFHY